MSLPRYSEQGRGNVLNRPGSEMGLFLFPNGRFGAG